METPSGEQRPSAGAVTLLVIDLLLALSVCLALAFVVPAFGDMFRDFGGRGLPRSTAIVLKISDAIMAFHGLGFIIMSCVSLWAIIRMYLALCRRGNREVLFNRLATLLVSLVVLIFIIVATMFLPSFDLGEVIPGPDRESNTPVDRTR